MKHDARILIVEDEAVMAKSIENHLNEWGYKAHYMLDSHKGILEEIERVTPDLVLMGVGQNGETNEIETIKEIQTRWGIPVIYLTAFSDETTFQRTITSSPSGYISKPFDSRILRNNIDIALMKYELEKKLRESEKRFRALIEDQTELICRWSVDGTYRFANDVYCRFVGADLETITLEKIVITHPEEIERVRDHFSMLTKDHPVGTMENRCINAEGETRWVQWTTHLLCDDQGQPVEYQSVGRDVTNLVVVQQELQERNEKYSTLIENMMEGMAISDFEEKFLFVNPTAESIFGNPPGGLIGRTLRDFTDEQGFMEFVEQSKNRRRGKTNIYEHDIIRPDGEQRRLLFTATPYYDKNEIVGTYGFFRDITEEKKTINALQESEERFRLAFEEGPIGMALVDREFNVIKLNRVLCDMTGYQEHELVGTSLSAISFPEDADKDIHLVDALFDGTIPSYHLEKRYIKKDGSILCSHLTATILRDSNGNPIYGLGMVEDITTRKQLETSLVDSQKFAALGTLAASVAHEINSPLQIITGVSESLLKHIASDTIERERLQRDIEMIKRNGWRMAEIVRSLLSYAREEVGNFLPEDLNYLIKDSLLLTDFQFKSRFNIKIVTDLEENLPFCYCNRGKITQVLINLLSNAREAMPNGGQITVRTQLDQRKQAIILEISDTGMGIPAEVQARIFDPFFTTKPLGQGTGLGLSIVKDIIQAHGGDISISSQPNQGATFMLTFPSASEFENNLLNVAGKPRFDES